MHNWRLLLLAFLAVLQPIVSFTERNLIDGREECCERNSVLRDSRLSYGFHSSKISEDHRISSSVRPDRRYEIRRELPTLFRGSTDTLRFNTVSSTRKADPENQRQTVAIRHERLSPVHDDQHRRVRDTHRISSRDIDRHLHERDFSRVPYSRESDKRQHARELQESSIIRALGFDSIISRRNSPERRIRMCMDTESRLETRYSRENTEERRVQERREARQVFQRARNDVARREIAGGRSDRGALRELAESRRAQSESRQQLDNNRKRRSFDHRSRDIANEKPSSSSLDTRFRFNERDTQDGRVNVRLMDRTVMFSHRQAREVQDRKLKEREIRDRSLGERRESREVQDRKLKEREIRDRSLGAQRESRETQDRNLKEREIRDRSLGARRESREVQDRKLKEREIRDRSLGARRESREVQDRKLKEREIRDRSLGARRESREVQDRNLKEREIRDRSLGARRESREVQDRKLKEREIRDRSLGARRESREVQDRNLKEREIRDRNLGARDRSLEVRARGARDRTQNTRKEIRDAEWVLQTSRQIRASRSKSMEARDRSLEAHRFTRNSLERIQDSRKESREVRDRNIEVQRESLVSRIRNLEMPERRSLEARRDIREARDRTLGARDETREARDRHLGARREIREFRDSVTESNTRRDSRVDNRRALNSRKSMIEPRKVESRIITGTRREIRMTPSLDARERGVSYTPPKLRNSNMERDARFRSNTQLRNRETLMSIKKMPQYDSEPNTMNWHYVLYTLQGIYVCGILMQMLSLEESSKKQRFSSWLTVPRNIIKVD